MKRTELHRRFLTSVVVLAWMGLVLLSVTGCQTPPKPEEKPPEAAAVNEDTGEELEALPKKVVNPFAHPETMTEQDKTDYSAATQVSVVVDSSTTLKGWLFDPYQQAAKEKELAAAAAASSAAASAEGEEGEDASAEEDAGDEDGGDAEAPRPTQRYPLVILLHGLNGGRYDWAALPFRLVRHGYAVLALDLRGHGGSILKGKDWRQFGPDDWKAMPTDLAGILRTLAAKGIDGQLQVDGQRVVLVGAGLGANVAVISASQKPATVKSIVMLSPTVEYKGLNTIQPAYRIQVPSLLVASQSDASAYESSQILYRLLSGKKTIQLYKNLGYGSDMIRFYPEMQDAIVAWIKVGCPPTPSSVPPPPSEEDSGGDEEE
ncbi:MAG: alpha/beta fold hydrolase [Vampirovibrionales bacterium]|nr:alpha/beta fold hydrolase [Vampirovibrionales bacterium]